MKTFKYALLLATPDKSGQNIYSNAYVEIEDDCAHFNHKDGVVEFGKMDRWGKPIKPPIASFPIENVITLWRVVDGKAN